MCRGGRDTIPVTHVPAETSRRIQERTRDFVTPASKLRVGQTATQTQLDHTFHSYVSVPPDLQSRSGCGREF